MLTLTEVSNFLRQTQCLNQFKPWWEHMLEYCITGLFLLNMLCWSWGGNMDVNALSCVPASGNQSQLAYSDMRYISSRCTLESGASSLVFFPFTLFAQWIILYTIQSAWMLFPTVLDRFMCIHRIITDISKLEAGFDNVTMKSTLHYLPKIEFDSSQHDKIKVLSDRIIIFMNDPSRIYTFYRIKASLTITLSLFSTLWIVIYYFKQDYFSTDFGCKIDEIHKNDSTTVMDYVCSTFHQLNFYSVILLLFIMMIIIILLSIYGSYWSSKESEMLIRCETINEHLNEYQGLPGYHDLKFCLSLLSYNVHDGGFIIGLIGLVLQHCNPEIILPTKEYSKRDKIGYEERFKIVTLISSSIGMKIVENSQGMGHLFQVLEEVENETGSLSLEICISVKEKIINELRSNCLYYRLIWQSLSSKNLIGANNNMETDMYFDYINKIEHESEWCDFLVLIVAANIFSHRFVFISADLADNNFLQTCDELLPYFGREYRDTVFLTFIPPYHYFYSKQEQDSDDETMKRKNQYEKNVDFRNTFRMSLHQNLCSPNHDQREYETINERNEMIIDENGWKEEIPNRT